MIYVLTVADSETEWGPRNMQSTRQPLVAIVCGLFLQDWGPKKHEICMPFGLFLQNLREIIPQYLGPTPGSVTDRNPTKFCPELQVRIDRVLNGSTSFQKYISLTNSYTTVLDYHGSCDYIVSLRYNSFCDPIWAVY